MAVIITNQGVAEIQKQIPCCCRHHRAEFIEFLKTAGIKRVSFKPGSVDGVVNKVESVALNLGDMTYEGQFSEWFA